MEISRQLSREATEEFKAIYEGEFGDNLSDDEAQAIGLRVLGLFNILLHPTPRTSNGIQNLRVPPD